VGDGILRLSETDRARLASAYAQAAAQGRILQFVPASGAATRMFKGLLAVLNAPPLPLDALRAAAARNEDPFAADARETLGWFQGLERFAFYPALAAALARGGRDAKAMIASDDYRGLLEALLTPAGLGFADKPKALIPFHAGPPARTALEEHLAEAAGLARDKAGRCRLHFTVSSEHEASIRAALDRAAAHAPARIEYALSQQHPFTDTLAADAADAPYRNTDGTLCFRPGGHGALLANLQDTGGDIVFVRNIDNVAPERMHAHVLARRRALGGLLVEVQDRLFAYLKRLRPLAGDFGAVAVAALLDEAERFAAQTFGDAFVPGPSGTAGPPERVARLIRLFDRPLRICAMVENQGEPGGGPFWVRYADGLRPQIVEAAQMDKDDAGQRAIAESATHFNPVDMVCGLRDERGEAYRLKDFVDAEACFISSKSKDGKILKALELPGLWNGSMAFWNTIFVEAPVETFNPVKTVNDLLRPGHQT